MQFKNATTGYSLVEVLVAISILMISIIGPITIAAKSLQSAQYARQQNTAFFLAQEGITMMNTLRNNGALDAYTNASVDAWDWSNTSLPAYATLAPCFTAAGCGMDFRDSSLFSNIVSCSSSATACTLLFDPTAGRASYQYVQGDASPYTRVIKMSFITANEIKVESTVTWASKILNSTQSVTLGTSLFNLYEF
jgi:Tfp pilus assembly protein PilV